MSKFIHALAIERIEYDEETIDSEGQPVAQAPTSVDVKGLVQPRSRISEADDHRSAGSEVGDHVIFFPNGTDIRHADAVVFGEERYSVTGVRRFRYGGLAHLEVDARLVTATAPLGAGS